MHSHGRRKQQQNKQKAQTKHNKKPSKLVILPMHLENTATQQKKRNGGRAAEIEQNLLNKVQAKKQQQQKVQTQNPTETE